MACEHTDQRRFVYGGSEGNSFECPCGKRFFERDLPFPHVIPSTLRKIFGPPEDCDAGNYLTPLPA